MSDLTEAIERVRRFNAGEPLLTVYAECKTRPPNRLGNWSDSDAAAQARAWLAWDHDALASAYVAEHPADDGNPMTDLQTFIKAANEASDLQHLVENQRIYIGELSQLLRMLVQEHGGFISAETWATASDRWGEYVNYSKQAIDGGVLIEIDEETR